MKMRVFIKFPTTEPTGRSNVLIAFAVECSIFFSAVNCSKFI